MINVLLVDDDDRVRGKLRRVLTAHADIAVVGEAASGKEAVRLVQMLSPNVIIMDTDMPGMDGFETTVEIMTRKATPIIMVSRTQDDEKADLGFRAMEAGAVALLAMPSGTGESHGRRETELVQTVRTMSEVRVVHRRQRRAAGATAPAGPPPQAPKSPARSPSTHGSIDLIAIGASTGGPQVLQAVLMGLPRPLPTAVLVVQHITPDFQGSFVGWLGDATRLPVHLAIDGEAVKRGTVYIAPHPFQMGIDRSRHIVLRDDPPESGLRPAVSYLFRSVAAVAPRRTAAVLLTGMGQDGAGELLELRAKGAITIAQDQETSIVHGMPGEAIRLGAAMHILPPDEIGTLLAQLTANPAANAAGGGRKA
jgi:two-component system, chemotaxis family, protein-glutamate methylesterase/glutaminase